MVGSSSLRLNLDASLLLEPRWTGLSIFTRRLAQALRASDALQIGFVSQLAKLPTDDVLRAIKTRTGAYLSDRMRFGRGVRLKPIDPKIPLLYCANKGRLNGVATCEASVIHDLTTLFMPETHDEGNIALHLDHIDEEFACSDALFCASAATAATVSLAAPHVAAKLRWMPQYVDWPDHFADADFNLPPPRLPPYGVMIGTIEPRKNLQLALRALDHPEVRRLQSHFALIGRQGWLVDDMLANITPDQMQRLTFTGYATEFVKYRLLRHADYLIFPGLCEGFGIPALEAMSLGKPVLASRSGSLPEVVGEAGLYFDPYSVDEFVACLSEIQNPRRRAELSSLALRRAAEFTPQRMAAPVIDWLKATN